MTDSLDGEVLLLHPEPNPLTRRRDISRDFIQHPVDDAHGPTGLQQQIECARIGEGNQWPGIG